MAVDVVAASVRKWAAFMVDGSATILSTGSARVPMGGQIPSGSNRVYEFDDYSKLEPSREVVAAAYLAQDNNNLLFGGGDILGPRSH
ncbi:hypothetical protein Nepgr_011403 [Nepenthes gracilis]|uniref:Uncharacterized protein n=1 Tax=Nepenthes gracilis TaxID=150966 RepID=A0AAD3SE99_NEPGR|nr:hypothetical protein Nepgr_011403 [Nepenthes gracilis]